MEFKKYDAEIEDFYDYNDDEVVVTLSLEGGNVPLMCSFCVGKEDLLKAPCKGDKLNVYLQGMASSEARFEVYKNESAFSEVHKNVDSESFFPEWENEEDGTVKYVEFANINGRVCDLMKYDEDNVLVKLCCQGFEISALIPKDMPVFDSDSEGLAIGDIVSGEFLMIFDLSSPY